MVRYYKPQKAENLFAVELWSSDGVHLLETLAKAGSFHLSQAAYHEALRRYPGQLIMVRHGARVVMQSS